MSEEYKTFMEDLLFSVEKLDAHAFITKNEKNKIHTRMAKALKKKGLTAVHAGFRSWRVENEQET